MMLSETECNISSNYSFNSMQMHSEDRGIQQSYVMLGCDIDYVIATYSTELCLACSVSISDEGRI